MTEPSKPLFFDTNVFDRRRLTAAEAYRYAKDLREDTPLEVIGAAVEYHLEQFAEYCVSRALARQGEEVTGPLMQARDEMHQDLINEGLRLRAAESRIAELERAIEYAIRFYERPSHALDCRTMPNANCPLCKMQAALRGGAALKEKHENGE